MTASPVERVVERLEQRGCGPKLNGHGWVARCPAHDDRSPSLGVTEGDDGRALVICRAGCDLEHAVLPALDLAAADLFARPNGIDAHRARPTIVASYTYVDEHGEPLFRVNRWEPGFDGERKTFRQQHPTGGAWANGMGGARNVLYRLPEVIAAVAAGEPVLVVEGEKDADRLAQAGYTATTNPMGAGKWRREHTDALRDAHVVVIADTDEPGRAHAEHVAQALNGVAASVRRAEPAKGKDVSDHLNAGQALEDLLAIDRWEADTIDAPSESSDVAEQPSTALDHIRDRLVRGLPAIRAIPPRRPLVADLLDLDSFAVLYGAPGSAKSFIATDLALHISTGSWWHGRKVRPGPVLYFVLEGAGGIGARVNAWAIQNRYHGDASDFIVHPAPINLLDVVDAHAIAAVAAEIRPTLVIIDTLNKSMPGGDENTSRDMGLVIAAAELIRSSTGACVLLVHHSGKDTNAGARGHSSLLGAVDTELEAKKADGIIRLSTTKQKDHAAGDQPQRFVLVPHTWTCTACAGKNDDCDICGGTGRVGSAAIAPYTGQVNADDGLDQNALDALAALEAIDVPGGVTSTEWKKAATAGGSLRSGMAESTFYEKRKSLLAASKVRCVGEGRAARYSVLTRDKA